MQHGSSDGVVAYDFRRPTKLSREHVRSLQMSYETFARRLSTLLTSNLRQICQISLVAIEHQSYEEYIASLESTTILSVLDMEGLSGTALLEFSVPTALGCVDYMLGGPGGDQPIRQLTEIEIGLLRNLIEQMLSVLAYATETTIGLKPSLRTIDYNPQFVQAAGSNDGVIVGSFEMRIGDQVCVATLCIPYTMVQPRLQAGSERRPQSAGERQAQERAGRQVRAALSNVPVDVAVSMNAALLTPSQIVALRPGDVVTLNHRVTSPLIVESGGITFAHALAGRQGSRLAGLVVSTPREMNQ